MPRIPKAGDPFTTDDFDQVLDAVLKRRAKFPDEPPSLGLGLVLMNIGDRYSELECSGGEWSGYIQDVVKNEDGEPRCSEGHTVLFKTHISLGWVEAE